MAFFKSKGKSKSKPIEPERSSATVADAPRSPHEVGIVSGILSASRAPDSDSGFGDVVARRFGPAAARSPESPRSERGESQPVDAPAIESQGEAPLAETLPPVSTQSVEPLFSEDSATPELEVDPMAHIGRATTITGDIVAEEDLEIQGTIEGAVRLAEHQLTIGAEGIVKANVEANVILVQGRVTGNVSASDLVEVKPGGFIGGDVRAPRVIMHDGAIVVGGLDMSAALPNGGVSDAARPLASAVSRPQAPTPGDSDRPQLIMVDAADASPSEKPSS